MNTQRIKYSLLLMLASMIWGMGFVAQSAGMEHVGAFTFNCIRAMIGGVTLVPCIALVDRIRGRNPASEAALFPERAGAGRRTLLRGGIACGAALAVASCFQQAGLAYTGVGKAGFITALYIIIVPILGLFFKRRVPAAIWAGAAIALCGMYLLCMGALSPLNLGDGLMLVCAFCFSLHILIVDHFSPMVDPIRMSCVQFFVCGLVCAVPMLLFERPTLAGIYAARVPLLYAGAMSSGVAYTLQIVGQRNTPSATASLILSLESVFAALSGWLVLNEALTARELIGCTLMFAAIILAKVPEFRRSSDAAGN